jgi:hypothetical protein
MQELERYRLRIEKSESWKHHNRYVLFAFGIIDLTRPYFPLSWVVNLPKDKTSITKGNLAKAFPDIDRIQFALTLLNQAILDYSDPEIVAEIKDRIAKLTPKLPLIVKSRS